MPFEGLKIKKSWKACFWGAVISGLLSYFYIMSNHFLTYDSMWNLYSDQDMISSGRQFLTYACGISSFYDLPAVNGFLAIFYLAITAIFVIEIFGVKGQALSALIGALMVTFPSVTSTFCYSYTIDGYMLAVLIITISFYLTNKYKYGFVPGIVLTGISIGIYQAYYSYLIVLCIIYLLLYIQDEDKISKIIKKAITFFVNGVGGYIFYFVTLKIMLTLKGVTMSGYQGVNSVLTLNLSTLLGNVRQTLNSFYMFAAWGNVFTTTTVMKIVYCICLVLLGVLYLMNFVKRKTYKSPWKIAFSIILILLMPLGLNVVSLMSNEVFYHLLMRYSWVLIFIFVIILAGRLEVFTMRKKLKDFLQIATMASIFVMVFEFGVVANIVAFNMEERYEKTYGYALRIVDRLEETAGYETGDSVAILGGLPSDKNYPETSITTEDLSGYFGVEGDYCANSTYKFATFASHYLGVTLATVPQEKENELAAAEEFGEMPTFPKEGSIKKIDGVWVVKING